MKENEDCEFVSQFFGPTLNLNPEFNNKASKFENDVFCFSDLMQCLLESHVKPNRGIHDNSIESTPFPEDNVQFTAEEIVSIDVDDSVKYDNHDSNDINTALCCNNGAAVSNVALCIQMSSNDLSTPVKFVSKYFVQSLEESKLLLDNKNSFEDNIEDTMKFNEDTNVRSTTDDDLFVERKQKVKIESTNEKIGLIEEDVRQNLEEVIEYSEEFGSSQEDREFRASQLDTKVESIIIEPFFNISPRKMPVSPHGIIEEEFKSNPWVMLVVTIFLTKTTGKAARPLMEEFFSTYPTPYDVLNTDPVFLERFFINLGMRKRAHMIWRMSYEFVSAKWRRASDLHGIGKYGEDAYRIFCLGHTDIEPTDRYLRLYLDWLKSHTDHDEVFGKVDSECIIVDPILKYYSITLR